MSETVKKKDENQEERRIHSLFMRGKEMKRVMLARKPMYLLMPHDYCLSSIASSLPRGVVVLAEVFSNLLRILLTSNLFFVMKSFGLGLVSKDFLSYPGKPSCSFVRVLISSNKRLLQTKDLVVLLEY